MSSGLAWTTCGLYSTKQNSSSFPKRDILTIPAFTERETEVPRREKQLGFTPRLIEQLSTAWGVHYMLCPGLNCPLIREINQTVGKSAQWAMAVKE